MHRAPATTSGGSILRPGETCWRIERAHRFALIVDADDYFAHAKAAMLAARHSIYLIGWDFDLRIRLCADEDGPDGTEQLGHFLRPEFAVCGERTGIVAQTQVLARRPRPACALSLPRWRGRVRKVGHAALAICS